MRNFSIFAILIAELFISGCDTLNHRQYLLVPVVSNSQLEELRTELGKVLAPVVSKYQLVDSRSDANASDVVLYFKTRSDFPIQVGAKNTSTGLVVDIIQFHPGIGEDEEYSRIIVDIRQALGNLKTVGVLELDNWHQTK